MTSYTTHSQELGQITFTAPSATERHAGAMFIEARAFTASTRCLYDGEFGGRGVLVLVTPTTLRGEAQKWLRQRRRWMRKLGF